MKNPAHETQRTGRETVKTSRIYWAIAICATLITASLFACQKADEQDGAANSQPTTLTVAYVRDFFPYASKKFEGPQGYAVDIAERIASEAGKQCTYVAVNDEQRATELVADGSADFAIGAFDAASPAPEGYIFSNPYIDVDIAVVALEDSGYDSIDDLSLASIATLSGSTSCDWALRNMPNANVQQYDSVDDAFTALESQKAQAVACGTPNALRRVKVAYADAHVIDVVDTSCAYAFACKDSSMAKQINKTLIDMEQSGEADALFESWFGPATQREETEARTNEQGAPTFAKR